MFYFFKKKFQFVKEEDLNENPALFFILKGEVEIYHRKSIRSNEEVSLRILHVS